MENMVVSDLLEFKRVLKMINNELNMKHIFDIEYLVIHNSVSDVLTLLKDESEYFNLIKDEKYENGGSFKELLEIYLNYVQAKYDSLMIKEGKSDKVADRYYNASKEPVGSRFTGYIQYGKEDIGMIRSEAEKTISLLREAIVAYYKVYYNKTLLAELSTNTTDRSEYFRFKIEEENLLHLLGITIGQLNSNPDFVRLTGKSNMNSLEMLEWIIKDIDGNNDLLEYNDDFLRRVANSEFLINDAQFGKNVTTRLINYHKVKLKSQTFLKYGPFEKVSLVAKLKNGSKLTKYSNSNTAMIMHANVLRKYPWAYFGSVQNDDEKYIETLLVDSSNHKKEVFQGSIPAIVKGIEVDSGGGPDGNGGKIFSDEEQFELFCEAYEAFQTTMDFENLKKYFTDLAESKRLYVAEKELIVDKETLKDADYYSKIYSYYVKENMEIEKENILLEINNRYDAKTAGKIIEYIEFKAKKSSR